MAGPMKGLGALSGLVYSTDSGRMCPECREAVAACACKARAAAALVGSGAVRVQRETKGRGGKAVTVVRGVALPAAELAALAKQLKTTCGSGGTLKDGVIEVQGDHVEAVMNVLRVKGLAPKKVGG